MLDRIRAATSGSLLLRASPARLVACCAWTPGVVRDLDLTAASASKPPARIRDSAADGSRKPVSPSLSLS